MKFSDLVGVGEMGELCKSFTACSGSVTAILDLQGNILSATGWQDLCTCFHRAHPETAARCKESDTRLACQPRKGQSYNLYQCKNGLFDVAVPIAVESVHIANFFTGQFFMAPPDEDYFIHQANKYGFDKNAYIEAVRKVPVVSEAHLRITMEFLSRLVHFISEMAVHAKRVEDINQKLLRQQERLEKALQERTSTAVRSFEKRLHMEQSQKYFVGLNKHFGSVLNSVAEGLITVDNEGLVKGINDAGARFLGVHAEDLEGMPIDKVLRVDSKLRSFLRTGRRYQDEELLLKCAKGEMRCVASANPIHDEDGSTLGTVFTFSKTRGISSLPITTKGNNPRYTFKDIIGESQAMRETVDRAKRIARSPSTVLILGESGTGKELFAQAIHNASDRRYGPFVSVNCGAIPRELIQSELFGYVEGAFTGARRGGRPGKLELANGGSIFLDEIGDMPLEMQVNLLRVLEDKTIVRIGGHKVLPVDVRIIAATNRNLDKDVADGRFREDLFYRLNVIAVRIPPLKERKGDIRLLTNHYVEILSHKIGKRVGNVEDTVFTTLDAHPWPGNIRELTNAIEYAVNLLQGEVLKVAHLPPHLQKSQVEKAHTDQISVKSMAEVEKETIEHALTHLDGNITRAASALGIGRNTLYDKIKKYGIRS